ncbi:MULTISPECIES: DUF305 domain-containing protein [unclassified Nocardiopsis]|uniref:DUF305 domain-containing protein n=1 Tax=unclassified Nocardiopsis TaxID=2649073 RepID=UPI00135A5C2F|nr:MULTISPECIES: DUF305 domain-containing protein [unclassified Nocardiopsis]
MTVYTRTRAFPLVPAALAAALLLSSCGTEGEETPAAAPTEQQTAEGQEAAEFNDADIMFAQMMIPHHEQAVEMSRLAPERAGGEVGDLAAGIEAAQAPEIEQLRQMLAAWGEEPEVGMGHEDTAGMMSEERMAQLEQAEGGEFDTPFLEMMIDHHEGAVAMARDELDNGVSPEAVELARNVVDTQEAEIERMRELLGEDAGDDDGTDGKRDHDDH